MVAVELEHLGRMSESATAIGTSSGSAPQTLLSSNTQYSRLIS